jgi:short-subunit dehydrogenase
MKALITGASSGIGKDMARYLASKNIDLILVARRKDILEKLKKELKVNVEIINLDLNIIDNAYKLYDMCKDKNIDILINNAGFGLFGNFIDTDLNKELEMINVNSVTPHILTKLFLQDFVKKDSGYILNTCSSAGFMAGPKLNTYYATKNYLLKLTMAINEELRQLKSNVYIGALCPGPVNTEFNKVAHGSFTIKGISSEYVAKYAIDKMFKRKMLIIPTTMMKLALFGIRFLPYKLQLKYTYNIQHSKIKKGNN